MADEEAVLKKKLEDTTDFEERRAIRQQLRDLRKKKLDALESGSAANERPRRRERVKKEEQRTVITETKTKEDSSQPAMQTKIEVNYSRTVITDVPAENGIENGHAESEKSVEEESVSAEDENPLEEQPVEVKNETQFSVQVNGEKSLQDSEPEQVDSVPQELSTETETAESSETAGNAEAGAEEAPKEDETEEVELTPEVIEKMEDVDELERLLKEVPLNEYALRKAIRLQIRQLRVKKEKSKESESLSCFRKVKQTKEDDLPANNQLGDTIPPRNEPYESFETETSETKDSSNETETTVSASREVEGSEDIKSNIDNKKSETVESDDDASSTRSSVTSESASEPDNPGKPPPRPPPPSKASSTRSESELTGDFKSRIFGRPAGPPPRDLTKKGKPSGPEQVDFRGQLKKTGLRADKDLTAQGKKKQELREGDVRGLLKPTGVDTSRNLSALRSAGKKKEGPVQVDFRGRLNKGQGEGTTEKRAPPRPPPTYLTKKAESGASTSQSPAKTQPTGASASKEESKPAESSGKEVRRISSADLFSMLHKPVESSKEGYLVQRGLKKAEASKNVAQKFIAPSVDTSTEDEKFKARMERRKERSEKLLLPGKGPKGERKMSAGVETKDFQSILKKAGAQQPRQDEKNAGRESEEQPDGASKRSERFSVDIQNKDELQKLRADLLREKEQKDKEGVTTTTEKSTEVEQIDGGQVTTEVQKTTEVHKAGGATMTVTKTTRKTEIQQTGGGKGAKGMSIEAMLAQKKKEKMMAKKQQQADTRNKRNAFKEQLEAQSPKVEGGGRNFQSGNAAINSLQEWCRRRTKFHEGVDIQNFTTSWANGLAMCALLNYFLPEKIPYETLDPKDKRANWALAFKVANEEGIEPLLELEDVMAVDVPEPKSLITYVHFIYQHFAEKQQQQKSA